MLEYCVAFTGTDWRVSTGETTLLTAANEEEAVAFAFDAVSARHFEGIKACVVFRPDPSEPQAFGQLLGNSSQRER